MVYSTKGAPCAQGLRQSVAELELLLSILRGLGGEYNRIRARRRENTGAREEATDAGARGHGRGSERTRAQRRKDKKGPKPAGRVRAPPVSAPGLEQGGGVGGAGNSDRH